MSPLRNLVLLAALGSSACVSKVTYDRSVADAVKAKADADARQKEDESQILALQQQVTAAEGATQDRDAKLSDLSTEAHNVQAQLDEQTAINQQLRGELQRLGKDVDKILAERGTLSKALDDARTRLEELRKAQASAEARVALFRDFERRFKPLVDAGQLRIETKRGQLVIDLAGDLLFDPGHAELRTAGKGVLMEVARALQVTSSPVTGRRYLVTAHTDPPDPVPPPAAHGRGESRSHHVRTAWELSAARAVTVVEYFVSLGVPPESLTAAGAGSFDPLVPNDGPEARAKNRRVEIALYPTADETLPVAMSKPAGSP
ncbi:MAG: OmpA family protein [Polyangiaceae bacterium]